MSNNKCDILYISDTFDYGKSVSGNYIIYKVLSETKFNIKVLPLFKSTNQKIDDSHFLPKGLDLNNLPEHDILLVSGDDLHPSVLELICKKHNSTLVCVTMTHWMYGNTSPYPELDNDFEGNNVDNRLKLYNSVKSYMITTSTHSSNVHKMSKFSNIPFEQIPFPFEEIDSNSDFEKPHNNKKIILWGTTQPQSKRKGKDYFENTLKWLYELVDNPNDILIQTIGPKSVIDTKFEVEHLGRIPNRMELSNVYKTADVFALTTLADAGPMMATECIRNGTPLVSYSTNISYDYIDGGKNGYIVEGSEEFAEKLYEILFNNNFHMDLEYVKKFNSQNVVQKKYEQFFNKLLNN